MVFLSCSRSLLTLKHEHFGWDDNWKKGGEEEDGIQNYNLFLSVQVFDLAHIMPASRFYLISNNTKPSKMRENVVVFCF